jgi:hypothetical protein
MPYYGGTPQAVDPSFLMDRLMQQGMTRMQAAAVVGNLQRESQLHTNIVNKDEGAYGLMQWRGPRFNALQDFATQQGKPWTDPGVQADFIGHELGGTERKNAQSFYRAPDLDSATKAFGQGVVRFGDESLAERQANARALFGEPGAVTEQATGAKPMVSRETQALAYGDPYNRNNPYGLLNQPQAKGIRGGLQSLGDSVGYAMMKAPRRPAPGSLFTGAAGTGSGETAAAAPSSSPAREQPSAAPPLFPGGIVPTPRPRPEAAPGLMPQDREVAPLGGLADFSNYRDSVDYGVG